MRIRDLRRGEVVARVRNDLWADKWSEEPVEIDPVAKQQDEAEVEVQE